MSKKSKAAALGAAGVVGAGALALVLSLGEAVKGEAGHDGGSVGSGAAVVVADAGSCAIGMRQTITGCTPEE